MKNRIGVLITVGIVFFGCGSNSGSADEISGTYVREYSFKVVSLESGAEIGLRFIRDTISIRPVEREFEISNHKWAKNDYDNDGWRNMEHGQDRPLINYRAPFQLVDNSLSNKGAIPLYFDETRQHLYRGEKKEIVYTRSGIVGR